jgi:sugar (pentulose or hexulose) kinase
VIVLDIGKTHVKLFAIEPDGGGVLEACQAPNRSLDAPPYLHVDVDRIWAWLIEALADLGGKFEIEAIVPCAYGSTFALIDDDGLVLPMMDYEADFPEEMAGGYAAIAPDFVEVCCPVNPGALTFGRQLFWQSRHFPEAFARVRWMLPAAQYWGWRLSGQLAAEVTSLGAQTQLWNPRAGSVTGMAGREGWADRLPPLRPAFETLGPLLPALANRLGCGRPPPVLVGIHDSNANYARYLGAGLERFTLISSGTWLITFDTDLALDRIDPERDMVANIDLEGRPVVCTRFMGGREFAMIAGPDGLTARPGQGDVRTNIERGTLALPAFTDSGGPFPGRGDRGRIEGPPPATPAERAALAALYTALVTDFDLDLLASGGKVVIDGSFAENPLFAGLLSALRPGQTVTVSREADGTALGASLLHGWKTRTGPVRLDLEEVPPIDLEGLDRYKAAWRRLALET